MAASFAAQLKDIAITVFALGKAQLKERLMELVAQTKESRTGQLLETTRQRISHTATASVEKPRRAAKQAHA